MTVEISLSIAASRLASAEPTFDATCTTTGAQTLTLANLDVAAGQSVTVTWGDGNSDVLGAGVHANVTHAYAGAGTWNITVSNHTAVIKLKVDDAKFGCAAGEIGLLTGLISLYLLDLPNVTVGAGEIGALTSLKYLYLTNGTNVTTGAGEIGGLTSLIYLYIRNLPNVTVGAGEIGALTSLTYLYINNLANCALQTSMPPALTSLTYQNSLTQANVDDLLFVIYTAALTRTGVNGTVNVSATNAAPSGVYQAAAACPVDAATPGKEVAHELTNDGCGAIANHWATVTFTA